MIEWLVKRILRTLSLLAFLLGALMLLAAQAAAFRYNAPLAVIAFLALSVLSILCSRWLGVVTFFGATISAPILAADEPSPGRMLGWIFLFVGLTTLIFVVLEWSLMGVECSIEAARCSNEESLTFPVRMLVSLAFLVIGYVVMNLEGESAQDP